MIPPEYVTLAAATGLMIGWESFQYFRHRKNLSKIPIRIHVNGTRGKSSVTRLIAAGLREGGMKVFAKTTGTLPRVITPDENEYPVFRPGGANIIEQRRIVALAAANDADALVVECMALHPHLQWVSESKLIRATHGVITNARPDHLDVMGPTDKDVALALAGSVPHRAKLFLGRTEYPEIFEEAAKERKSFSVRITEEEARAVSKETLSQFSYIEHPENIALALKVCEDIGVARDKALRGMTKAAADPGAMIDVEVAFFGRTLYFVNGFAANDPTSTEKIWKMALEKYPNVARRIAIFNCRADRPERSLQLGSACVDWNQADCLVLMGSGTYIFARAAAKSGMEMNKLIFADDESIERIFEKLVEISGPKALIVGMGNIGGDGLELVRFFKNRAVIKKAA